MSDTKIEEKVASIENAAKHLAIETKRLNGIKKDAIERMNKGEMLTYEQGEILGIEEVDLSILYQIGYELFSLKTMRRFFRLKYLTYNYKGKTYFAPKSIKVSLPKCSSNSSWSWLYQSHNNSTKVYIDKIYVSKTEKIMDNLELPTEIYVLIKYSAYRDNVINVNKKNGKVLMRLSSNREQPQRVYTFGDFWLQHYDKNDGFYCILNFE